MSSHTSTGYHMSKLCRVINLLKPHFLYNVVSLWNSGFLSKAQIQADLLLSSKCWLSPHHELLILSHSHSPIYHVAMREASRGPSLCFEQAFLQLLLKNWLQTMFFLSQANSELLACHQVVNAKATVSSQARFLFLHVTSKHVGELKKNAMMSRVQLKI